MDLGFVTLTAVVIMARSTLDVIRATCGVVVVLTFQLQGGIVV